MSEQTLTKAKVWLSAKDNWLGEGIFRPTPIELEQAADLASQKQVASAPRPEPAYADVYFAHG